ncbi:putative inactive leucine-rich repeat receptor-like protein kinase [Glycine soja]
MRQLQASLGADEEGRRSVVDPTFRKAWLDQSLKTMMEICVRCLVKELADRPSIEYVLWNLQFASQVQHAWRGHSQSSEGYNNIIIVHVLHVVTPLLKRSVELLMKNYVVQPGMEGNEIVAEGPRCSLHSRKVYSALSVDYLKMFLLNVPATVTMQGIKLNENAQVVDVIILDHLDKLRNERQGLNDGSLGSMVSSDEDQDIALGLR